MPRTSHGGRIYILDPHFALRGKIYVPSHSYGSLRSRAPGKSHTKGPHLKQLSNREFQIFQLIGRGIRTPQVAKDLRLSRKTIEAYREKLKIKLNFRHMHELVQFAIHFNHASVLKRPK